MSVSEQPTDDRIIEEVRRNREQLLRDCGGSLDGAFEWLKDAERSESREVVKLPPRRLGEPGSDTA
jgi:hypothetical protein